MNTPTRAERFRLRPWIKKSISKNGDILVRISKRRQNHYLFFGIFEPSNIQDNEHTQWFFSNQKAFLSQELSPENLMDEMKPVVTERKQLEKLFLSKLGQIFDSPFFLDSEVFFNRMVRQLTVLSWDTDERIHICSYGRNDFENWDEIILITHFGFYGLSDFRWNVQNQTFLLNWILVYKWKDFNWDLNERNQLLVFGDNCLSTSRKINYNLVFWKSHNVGIRIRYVLADMIFR